MTAKEIPEKKSLDVGPKSLILPPDFEEKDYLAEGYQEIHLQYFQTCANCGLQFSTEEKPDPSSQRCGNCALPKTAKDADLSSGQGEEYVPFEPDNRKLFTYLFFWYGRMNRGTFFLISLGLCVIGSILGGETFLGLMFPLQFVQMIKREHDLGRGWRNLTPLAIFFLFWVAMFFLNFVLMEKIAFILYTFLMAASLFRLWVTPGAPGRNRFGPVPGFFQPFEGSKTPAPVTIRLPESSPEMSPEKPVEGTSETSAEPPSEPPSEPPKNE